MLSKHISRLRPTSRCLSLQLRQQSGPSVPPISPPSSSSRVQPTTFSERSSPRQVHERPEVLRGMPPDFAPSWAKSKMNTKSSETEEEILNAGPGKEAAEVEAFSGPSHGRLVYSLPPRKPRDLPKLGVNTPFYIGMAVLGISAWGIFLLYATNAERLASSVMRSVQFHLRHSKDVAAVLGNRVRLAEPPWIVGDPWISGTVNTLQGKVDLSFRVRGDNGEGTVYFTSIRPHIGEAWTILRYKLIADSGEVLRLETTIERITDNSVVNNFVQT